MKFSTDWDVNYYKTDYESEEHWELRKKFMEVHKDRFPEDELVCLAQVFTNVEFMGCRYPDETMRLVAELSQEIAAEYREEHSRRLKRTFIKASDAAEQRAKGRRKIGAKQSKSKSNIGIPISNNYWKPLDKKKQLGQQSQKHSILNKAQQYLNSAIDNKIDKIKLTDLFTGPLMFGSFVLYYFINDRNCLKVSSQKCNITVDEKEIFLNDEKKVEIYVGGVLAGFSKDLSMKEAKNKAYDAAIKKLKQECYVIKPNTNPDRIHIRKNNQTIVANLHKTSPDHKLKLDSNNIGYKMMLKQGWNGGGLGLKTQGREDPIDFLVKNNRKGFGNEKSDELNANYFRNFLTNYIKSEDIRDLYFESDFTKEERASLHQIASSKNLKSSSHGKEPQRHLVISKKNITSYRILEEVLINKNPVYMNKYEVKVPRIKTAQFPNHAKLKPT